MSWTQCIHIVNVELTLILTMSNGVQEDIRLKISFALVHI